MRPAILRRLDVLAVLQLHEHVLRLEAENEDLRRRLAWAEDAADHWHQNARDLAGDNAGLTQAGQLVRMPG